MPEYQVLRKNYLILNTKAKRYETLSFSSRLIFWVNLIFWHFLSYLNQIIA